LNEQQVFMLADRALASVVDQIRDDQWEMQVPPDFPIAQEDQGVTLRKVVNYHAYDEAWVPDILAGRTMDEVGSDKFDGDLLGENPKVSFAALVEAACAAVEQLDDPERTTHLSYGDYPAREYLTHITSFRGLRAYDIAKVIGADTTLPSDLVQGLWEQIEPSAEDWRALGVFGPRVEVPADASLQDRLLGLTGRDPNAT
jgi:uncharacterized protein (TIGR03086 family)